MSTSDVISIVALIVALLSFGVAAYTAYMDHPRLKITSKFYPASEYGPDRIHITLINAGRRPVILRLIGGTDTDGNWSGTHIEYEKGGLRLGEHERNERTLTKEDAIETDPEGEVIVFHKLWVEDSIGNRHFIPASDLHLKRLLSNSAA